MAFTLPTFNLVCDFYTGPWATKAYRLTENGNLAWGKRTLGIWGSAGDTSFSPAVYSETLLLPALTDVRSAALTGHNDLIEVPSGSGRWYVVQAVDDIGKGFANEHRAAIITMASQYVDFTRFPGLFWPVPMP